MASREMFEHVVLGHDEIVIPAVDHDNGLLTARCVKHVNIGDVRLYRGSTLFIAACTGGHLCLANTLADRGSDVHAVDNRYNWNALMYASRNGHRNVAAMILDRGINLEVRDNVNGRTFPCEKHITHFPTFQSRS